MAESRYDLVITQYLAEDPIEDVVAQLMKVLNSDNPRLEFKLSDALLFENGNSAALENITEEEAKEYQKLFLDLMVESEVRPSLQVVTADKAEIKTSTSSYTCPACGHEQAKQDEEDNDGLDTCEACGVIGEKYLKLKRKEEILEDEKRKNKAAQAQQVKEQLERARSDLEEKMRREARQELGLENEKGLVERFGSIALVVVGIAVVANIGFMLHNAKSQDTSEKTDKVTASETAPTTIPAAATENIAAAANKTTEAPPAKGGTIPASALASVTPKNPPSGNASDKATGAGGTSGDNTPAQASTTTDSAVSDSSKNTQASAGASSASNNDSDIKLQLKDAVYAAYENRNGKAEKSPETQDQSLRKTINKQIRNFRKKQNQRFNSIPHQQHKAKVQRLLELGRIDLATVFAQELDDKYEASVLLLDILKVQLAAEVPEDTKTIMTALKELEELSRQPQQRALLNGSLCAAHAIMANDRMAGEMLSKAQKLASITNSPLEKIKNLTQLANEQNHLGNTDFASTILNTAMPFAQQIDEEQVTERALVFTHLAHSHAQMKQLSTAHTLLRNVSDDQARANLSAYFNEIQ